jgi:hypothetical protein
MSSYEGGGLHGHLGIIMTNNEYFAVATDVFPNPENPVDMAKIVTGMMASQFTEANQAHVEATRIYHTYHNMDQAFKKLIIDAFKDPFLNALSEKKQ